MSQNQALSKPKSHRIRRILAITGIVPLVLLLAGYFAIGAIAADKLTIAQRVFTTDTPQAHGMNYEDVTFPAREDGLTIAAWYIPAEENQAADQSPAIVMVTDGTPAEPMDLTTTSWTWHRRCTRLVSA